MENAGSLDFLVKLASFGTAGVCILAIFFIGSAILKLPNDSPNWKPALMRRFITACIVIAGITAFSGGLNAYFNRGKVVEAVEKTETSLNETKVVADEYQKLSMQYNELSAKVGSLIERLNNDRSKPSPQLEAEASQIKADIRTEEPKPLNEILTDKSLFMIRSKQIKAADREMIRR